MINKVKKSKNALIEDAYIDFLEFNEPNERTDKKLLEQIEWAIYTAEQNEYDYSIQCINGAKKFLRRLKNG